MQNEGSSVSWLINGIPRDGAELTANGRRSSTRTSTLRSSLEARRNRVRPYGIAGAFTATYTDVGKMVGAFGAHAPQ